MCNNMNVEDITEEQKKSIKNLLEETDSKCSICIETFNKNKNVLILWAFLL